MKASIFVAVALIAGSINAAELIYLVCELSDASRQPPERLDFVVDEDKRTVNGFPARFYGEDINVLMRLREAPEIPAVLVIINRRSGNLYVKLEGSEASYGTCKRAGPRRF